MALLACSTPPFTPTAQTAVTLTQPVFIEQATIVETTETATSEPTAIPTSTITFVPPTLKPSPTVASTGEPTSEPTQQRNLAIGETAVLTQISRNATYLDPVFGLGLTVPKGWTLMRPTETTNLRLTKDVYSLLITMRNAEHEAVGGRTGTGAGEFITVADEESIYGLGQPIGRTYLQFEGRRKMVVYRSFDNFRLISGDFEAFVTFDLYDYEDYREIDLSDEIIAEADEIIASLWLAEQYQAATVANTPAPTETVWLTHVFTSTNHEWIATATSFSPFETVAGDPGSQQHRQLFVVERADGSASWAARDVLEGWGLGVGHYAPLQWTDDVLYFTYRPIPDGGGCRDVNGSDLWSLNLNDGTVAQLAPDQLRFGIIVSVTQHSSLRFVYNTERGFAMRQPNAEQILEYVINVPNLATAGLHWSPVGNRLLLIDGGNCPEPNRLQRIFVISLADMTIHAAAGLTGSRPLRLTNWLSDDVALLQMGEQHFTFDLATGDLLTEPPPKIDEP